MFDSVVSWFRDGQRFHIRSSRNIRFHSTEYCTVWIRVDVGYYILFLCWLLQWTLVMNEKRGQRRCGETLKFCDDINTGAAIFKTVTLQHKS